MQASDRVTYQVLSTACDFTGPFSTPQRMDGFTTALPSVLGHVSLGGSSTWAHPVSLQTLAPSKKACQGMALPPGLLKTRPTGYLNCLLESCHVVLPDLLSLFHLWGGGGTKNHPGTFYSLKLDFWYLIWFHLDHCVCGVGWHRVRKTFAAVCDFSVAIGQQTTGNPPLRFDVLFTVLCMFCYCSNALR